MHGCLWDWVLHLQNVDLLGSKELIKFIRFTAPCQWWLLDGKAAVVGPSSGTERGAACELLPLSGAEAASSLQNTG